MSERENEIEKTRVTEESLGGSDLSAEAEGEDFASIVGERTDSSPKP